MSQDVAVEFETLKRLGGKWAVLMSMSVDMARNGAQLPPDLNDTLTLARMKIGSGCFSVCEVGCALSDIESRLSSHYDCLDEDAFAQWSDLLGEAMQGNLDHERIVVTPALEPVKNDCMFLKCACS